MILDLLQF